MNSNTGQTILALLTGAVIGAGIGILFAPYKGSETREKIGKGARNAQKNIKKKVNDASSVLGEKAKIAKENFEERLNETLYAASSKADEVLLAMEEKLEELRKKNSNWQQRKTEKETPSEVK
ncbi:MAG: YtxH domain-containing protein [Bacteroidetes bacterium]|jgi:gas vesicle protein|nr:YtxH domain-containing protein [Bacteroidota bacterium]